MPAAVSQLEEYIALLANRALVPDAAAAAALERDAREVIAQAPQLTGPGPAAGDHPRRRASLARPRPFHPPTPRLRAPCPQEDPMTTTTERTGLWLVGAGGSVAATVAAGLAALRAGVATSTGLVTAQPDLDGADLVDTADLVTGGHDVTSVSLAKRAEALAAAGVIPHDLPRLVAHDLDEASTRVRQGYTLGAEGQREAVERLAADLRDFREREGLARVVVVNVSSTEAPVADLPAHTDRASLERVGRRRGAAPPEPVYAAAAFAAGCAFVDFTPSTGARLPVLEAMAAEAGMPWGGSDGKTGETLLKSVIAPMFAMRSLDVRSWAGTNLLGGGDGATLASPDARRSKIDSKAAGLEALLGHEVEDPSTSTTSPTSAIGRPRGTT